MKKVVLNLDLQNDKELQRRALKTVATLSGIDEISIDLKGKKLTVIGTVDPITVVGKLRKRSWPAHIISVGPAKDPEKKEEPKKEESKEEPKKEEAKKEEGQKEEAKKEEKKPEPELAVGTAMQYRPYRPYYPPMTTYYPVHHSMEENPNACNIS